MITSSCTSFLFPKYVNQFIFPQICRSVYTVKSRYLEVDGTIFVQVQITRSANYFALRVIWTCKKSPTPNYCWRKQSNCIFDSDRRFELRRIRNIRVRDIEIRLYFHKREFSYISNSDKQKSLLREFSHFV